MSKLIIKNKFATTPNELLYNPEISLRAKGLYGYIQAKPDGWNFSAERIATESKEGLHAVRMALKELETHGYLQRIKSQDEKGFWTIDYVLHSTPINPAFENPTCENPTCENTMSENPTSENPTSENCTNNINKDSTKQLFKNKEEEKKEEESDFVEFDGLKYPKSHIEHSKSVISNEISLQTFMQQNSIKTIDGVKSLLMEFNKHLNIDGKYYDESKFKEYRQHFVNWYRRTSSEGVSSLKSTKKGQKLPDGVQPAEWLS